ncbi:Heterogeneous nuclear ribonucleoprotein 1 [Acorus calamus]|uniref:Heterogeneous nuclear ribonucleoprotein 1 n=1 Tax=Acorus calamus TaxID=4465 RepID=A0AAV9EN73_ACOCL|nr:Heterogeneous nuclear ribonucleoprotein 1 [Acorus calamus]
MDSDQGKLFIGGISWETTEEKLKEYFGKYGEVVQTIIMRDKLTGRPRGFGFVGFADPAVLDRILEDKHIIDGRTVEAKRAMSREEQHTAARSGNPISSRGAGGGGAGGEGSNVRTKKIFVGGLPPTLTEEGFRQYFETYGHVTDVVVMYDQTTQRPRGFGFISFDSEDAVDRVLHKNFHEVGGKMVEVKRALPKDANPNSGARSMGAGASGGYQGYGSSGASTGTYDNRMDANRYMQPQVAGGGFSGYGSSGYGTPSYGYGAANNGVGYGSYGVGGYGGAATGYGAPAGAYGNPNASTGGYLSGPPGAPRSPWSNQAPTGYGSTGYGGSAGYGAATGAWNSGAPASAASVGQTGQPPSGAAGYGSQGYGYGGGYGGSDGSYGGQGGYGAVGGRAGSAGNAGAGGDQQGAGYGYGDANGNSGYQGGVWRSDHSQGYGAQASGPPGQGGYGVGYGGAQPRQAQQQ